jgi:hypothetical protein
MAGPDWLRWTFTALFFAVAAYCVFRLARARHVPALYHGCHRATDVGHGMMSAAMAVMCSPVGGPVPVAGWQTIFLVSTSWFAAVWWRQRHARSTEPIGWQGGALHHAISGLAMLYMLTAMPGEGHHMGAPWVPAMHSADLALPLVAWAFAAYFVVHATALWSRVLRPTGGDQRLPAVLTSSRLAASCQVFMALGMSYVLVA